MLALLGSFCLKLTAWACAVLASHNDAAVSVLRTAPNKKTKKENDGYVFFSEIVRWKYVESSKSFFIKCIF